jgi:protein TonB
MAVGIVAAVFAVVFAMSMLVSQSSPPHGSPSAAPPASQPGQTQSPAGSGPVTPPPEPEPPRTQPAPSPAAAVGDAPGPKLIRHVAPVYPPLAKQAGIQGAVAFKAIIATDGTVKSLELVHGHPLLVPAAQAAVKQWRYEPAVLNGVPVEVVTQIEVNFTLGQ